MQNKYAIVDWDDTLFDTYRFRKDTDNIFEKHGVNPAMAQQVLQEKMERERIASQDYTPELHLQALRESGIVDNASLADISDQHGELIRKMAKYFPNSSLEFLLKMRDELKIEPIILTYGHHDLQSAKIKNSGIMESINGMRIYIIQTDKKDFIEHQLMPELGGKDHIAYFINDKISETAEIYKALGIPCLLKVPSYICNNNDSKRDHHCKYTESDYKESGLPYFTNFLDIYRHIEQAE